MTYYYVCENDYCNHKWHDNATLLLNECPFCGCKYIIVEELSDPIPTCKSSKRKKKKKKW